MERIISEAIMDWLKVNQGIRPSQHGFSNGRSHLTNLISFYDKVICLVDEGKASDVVYLDFSNYFDTVAPQHSHADAGCPWFGWVYTLLGKILAGGQGPKSCSQWS